MNTNEMSRIKRENVLWGKKRVSHKPKTTKQGKRDLKISEASQKERRRQGKQEHVNMK